MNKLIKFNIKKYGEFLAFFLLMNTISAMLINLVGKETKNILVFLTGVMDFIIIIYSMIGLYESFTHDDMQEHIIPFKRKDRVISKVIFFSISYFFINIFYSYTNLWGKEDSVVYAIKEPIKFYIYILLSNFGGFIGSCTLLICVLLLSLEILKLLKRKELSYGAFITFMVLFITIVMISMRIEFYMDIKGISFPLKDNLSQVEYSYSTKYLFLPGESGGTLGGSKFNIEVGTTIFVNYIVFFITSILSLILMKNKKI